MAPKSSKEVAVRSTAIFILILSWCSLATAGVINVEFKFTPFIGDPVKNSQVETVAGKARVFINNVMLAEQEVSKQTVPVIFEEREIAPSVWVETAGLKSRIRKGKNIIRIEFEPVESKAVYDARLAWSSVTNQTTKQEEPGRYQETNQTGQGHDTKRAVGKVTFEREFTADFATDLPWHHYPSVTSLSSEDKQRLVTLINDRLKFFKPDFAGLYRFLETIEGINVNEVRKAKCLDKAYAVGIRIGAPARDQVDFVTTGNPEVVLQRRGGDLFAFENKNLFERVGDDDMQMCAGMALYMAYPPRLTVVRSPSGAWEVVY
jgi:hypothetical protein